jgi:magnesium-transporting ATPase (P-type)
MAGEFNPLELTEEKKAEILNKVIKLNFAPQALRTIMVAYKDMSMSEFNELKASNNNFEHVQDKQVLEQGLTMICIYGL